MKARQSGLTLVVSLIMLIVLTLLVVAAVRFGNINLQIAGNAQSEAEASAATLVALETVVAEVKAADNIQDVTARTINVSTGGKTYAVAVAAPSCVLTNNVSTSTLDPSKATDKPCFQCADCGEIVIGADGKPVAKPSACKDQNWDVQASISSSAGDAPVTMLQGISVRVGAEVQCP